MASFILPMTHSYAVLISDRTHRLVDRFFECESLGRQRVRGVAGKQETFSVLSEKSASSRVDVDESAMTPLVGRDREVGLLEERWELASEGTGQVVLLIGEAGLGKSRLLRVLKDYVADHAPEETQPVIEWRTTPQHQSSSLYPAIECFERLLNFSREVSDTEKLDRLMKHLAELNLDGDEEVGLLASLLSIPLDHRIPALTLTPQKQKESTLLLLHDWLREMSDLQPILFIIEDLHWIDPTTLELVETLVEEGDRDPILMLLTFRPDFETPWSSKAHHTGRTHAAHETSNRRDDNAQSGPKRDPAAHHRSDHRTNRRHPTVHRRVHADDRGIRRVAAS